MQQFLARPAPTDHAPYYADYVAKVPAGHLIELMNAQLDRWGEVVSRVHADRETFRYAEGKWSIRELLRHVLETEVVFGYRALCFARRDPAPLPGYDQDLYIENGRGDTRTLAQFMEAFEHTRRANLSLFATFSADDLAHVGRMWDKDLTLLSLVCLVHGHAEHHLDVLIERYGV